MLEALGSISSTGEKATVTKTNKQKKKEKKKKKQDPSYPQGAWSLLEDTGRNNSFSIY
jgi:hypothetical protein